MKTDREIRQHQQETNRISNNIRKCSKHIHLLNKGELVEVMQNTDISSRAYKKARIRLDSLK